MCYEKNAVFALEGSLHDFPHWRSHRYERLEVQVAECYGMQLSPSPGSLAALIKAAAGA